MLRPAAVKCLATSERATLERGTKACAIKEEKVGYYFLESLNKVIMRLHAFENSSVEFLFIEC